LKIIDEKTLDLFRGAGLCEWCGHWFAWREPHHWHAKGLGGGSRIDLPRNLLSLCRQDHSSAHRGVIDRKDLLRIIAKRERCTPEECVQEIWDALRKDKPL
jgi:hypothetical protein